jgi:hypothetical protein
MREVLISALVAAVVTLGIEFFAKPSLEARKERILGRHRLKGDLLKYFRRVGYRLGSLAAHDELGAPVKGPARADMAEDLAQLRTLLIDHPTPGDDLSYRCLSAFESECRAYLQRWQRGEDQAGVVEQRLSPAFFRAAEALATPQWRIHKRRKLRTSLEQDTPGSRVGGQPVDQAPR